MTTAISQYTDLEVQWFTMKLENRYYKSYGDDFENFIGDILSRRFPGDFWPIGSGGGDLKNDGIIRSRRELIQCYAPNKYSKTRLNNKIAEDYLGAIANFDKDFDTWVFAWCHSKSENPDAETFRLISELQKANKKLIVLRKKEEFIIYALEMGRHNLVIWLGDDAIPRELTDLVQSVNISQVGKLCEHVFVNDIFDDDIDMTPVPPSKIEYNGISPNIRDLLQSGMKYNSLITRYFENHRHPTFADQIAKVFADKYEELSERGNPDTIYWGLFDYILSGMALSSRKSLEFAAHALLAYLFEKCNIFKRPPIGWTGTQ